MNEELSTKGTDGTSHVTLRFLLYFVVCILYPPTTTIPTLLQTTVFFTLNLASVVTGGRGDWELMPCWAEEKSTRNKTLDVGWSKTKIKGRLVYLKTCLFSAVDNNRKNFKNTHSAPCLEEKARRYTKIDLRNFKFNIGIFFLHTSNRILFVMINRIFRTEDALLSRPHSPKK